MDISNEYFGSINSAERLIAEERLWFLHSRASLRFPEYPLALGRQIIGRRKKMKTRIKDPKKKDGIQQKRENRRDEKIFLEEGKK